MKYFIFLILSLLLAIGQAEAGNVNISASGGWNFTIDASDLISGPGSDIRDKESAPNASLLTVSATGFSWRVDVRRADTSWNGNLTLYLRRTSDGTGSGIVFGGSSYIPVGIANSLFFSGSGSRSGMGGQYKLGSSVKVPPGSYGTTVIYTITQQ
jgi:uncharacterized membrane protein YgcG